MSCFVSTVTVRLTNTEYISVFERRHLLHKDKCVLINYIDDNVDIPDWYNGVVDNNENIATMSNNNNNNNQSIK